MTERKIVEISHYTNDSVEDYGVVDELIEAYEVKDAGVIIYVTTLKAWSRSTETQNTFLPGKRLVKTDDETWSII